LWNAEAGTSGAFATYNAGSGTNGLTNNGTIPAGQGFYVEALSASALDFGESVKVSNNTGANPLLKPAAGIYGQIFRLTLSDVNGKQDEAAFRIHQNATLAYDIDWDAHKFFNAPNKMFAQGQQKFTTISSKDALNVDYSINSIPLLLQPLSIPVLVKVATSGTYTIQLTEEDVINTCYVLKDNLLNVTHDLKTGPYICAMSDTASAARFELQLCKDPSATAVGMSEIVSEKNILISQDANGAFVRTAFNQNTKATISAYNIVGQKLMDDVKVDGTVTETRLNLGVRNQVVLIKVTTDTESFTKKIVAH
jgi:hypothetical protein